MEVWRGARRGPLPVGHHSRSLPSPRTIGLEHSCVLEPLPSWGASNVGKSTFLNRVLGEPLAIVSPLPQTTRDNVLGVVHREGVQLAFLDTPGVHVPRSELGRRMNASALDAARSADVVLFMTDISALSPPKKSAKEKSVQELDQELFASVPKDAVVVLAVNKVDALRDKSKLLPALVAYQELRNFAALIPISVKADDGVERVLDALAEALPEGGHRLR